MIILSRLLPVITLLLLVTACTKEDDPPLVPGTGGATADCGTPGSRLQATIDGSAYCPDVNLFAALGAGAITMSGLSSMGSTLTLEIDSLGVGSYSMSETANTLLHTTTLGLGYMSSDSDPATLTITEHDTTLRRIKGSFAGTLYSAIGAAPKNITGSFDMLYTE
jgi:hypothetical protein